MLLLVVTIIQTKKIPQKRLVISMYNLMKVFIGPDWVKLGGNTFQQITIAFVFVIYILKKISFNAIYKYVVFYLPIKTLSSFVSFHVFNVCKWVLKVITVFLEIPFGKNLYRKKDHIETSQMMFITSVKSGSAGGASYHPAFTGDSPTISRTC